MSTKIKFKQIAFPSNDKAFIKGDGTFDSNNYLILDDNDKIPEEHIPDSVILKAIYYEDFINADYTPKLGETIIIIDYIKVDNKNVPSFIIGDGTTPLKDLSPSGDFTKWKETIDYSASAEPTLNTSKEDTLKGHLSYLAKGVKWIKGQFSKYLPLSGGTMSGAIDMNKFSLKTAGFETVTALPTTNLFVGRKVVMNGIEYTYNGVKFIANGINTIDKSMTSRNLTTLTSDEISYNDIVYNTPYIYASSFNSTLESFTPEVVEKYADNSWQTISFPSRINSSNTPIRFTMFENNVISQDLGYISSIFMWTRDYGHGIHIKIEYRSYNTDTQTYDWFIVKELNCIERTCIIPLPSKTLYPSKSDSNSKGLHYIDNVRITISLLDNAAQFLLRGLKFNTTGIIPLTDVKFDINYDALIKPTQSGNTVTKTNNWVLQYLTQGVHWLRDNKVETNTAATLKKLTLSDNLVLSNGTTTPPKIVFQRNTTTDDYYDYFIKALSSGGLQIGYNTMGTGVDNQMVLFDYNGGITATKLIKSGGTSSQFLKADGSVDSNTYAILNEEGKVERAILADDLGGREETREEQFVYQSTANDESVKDGLAIVKGIKGNTVVANQLVDTKNIAETILPSSVLYITNKKFFEDHLIYVKGRYICSDEYPFARCTIGLSNYGNLYGSASYLQVIKDNSYHTFSRILQSKKSTNNTVYLSYESAAEGLLLDKESLQIINLTQMFGEGDEPTTVEEFERLYPNLPTEYNAGSLLNLNADSIKSVGFNAFNGEYAKVLGGMQYYLNGVTSLAFKENLTDEEEEVIDIPSDNLYTPNTNGYLIAEGSNICINLSHSGYRNGEYEPYKESIVNLPIKKYFPDGMKSVGDARDEIVWDESIEKYKAIQRVGSVDMGTIIWSKGSTIGEHWRFVSYPANNNLKPKTTATATTKPNCLCINYNTVTPEQTYMGTKGVSINNVNAPYLINDESFTDSTSLQQSLQGQILYYELETPIETIIDDHDLIDYEVSDFGTEEILSDEPTTPIVADIQYGFNAVDEIRNHRFAINKLKKDIKDGTLTITQGEEILGEFSANQESNTTIEIPTTKKLEHTLTIGSYKYDGSEDINIPIYDNEYIIN